MNPQKNLGYRLLMMGLLILLSGYLNISQVQAQISPNDWQKDWEVAPGLSISLDSDGFELPTGIAFVPNPGEEPKDPLYYVIELRGKIKVVTNDRSIFTFAEDFFYTETPADITGDVNDYGLVGLCLEPTNGFVFVTYLTRLEDGTFRNRITRFQSQPNTFSQTFTDKIDITSMFQNHPESFPHTIGRCFTQDEYLYVGVGYGNNALNAQSLDSPLGKILRMTFDGLPIPENPFYIDSAPDNPKNYIWASGFRNPFGMEIVDDRFFVLDNGDGIDRFLEVSEGQEYFWDGGDWSIGIGAEMIFSPAIGPTQMEHISNASTLFPPQFRNSFYVGTAAWGEGGIIRLPYNMNESNVPHVPEYILHYRPDGQNWHEGMVVGFAVGPDGLYFAPFRSSSSDYINPVLKITYDPPNEHIFTIGDLTRPEALIDDYNCLSCHTLYGNGNLTGPVLDYAVLAPILEERLNSAAYLEVLAQIDKLTDELFVSFTQARQDVRDAEGQEKLQLWVTYHLIDPHFDNPTTSMPTLGLTYQEAESLAEFLLTPPEGYVSDQTVDSNAENLPLLVRIWEIIEKNIPAVEFRYLPLMYITGILTGVIGWRIFLKRKS